MKKKFLFLSALFLCLFLNAPIINAQAKTRKSYVFTISEFEKEANKIAKNIENDTSVIPFVDECEVFVFESEKDFIDKWNSIEEAEQIIIDCHGCRSVIGTEGPEINVGFETIQQLNCINCKRLILLPCSTFSMSSESSKSSKTSTPSTPPANKYNNIATAFVTRISGRRVIASDDSIINAGLTNLFSSDIHFRTFGNWYLIQESGYKKLGKKCYSIIELVHIN